MPLNLSLRPATMFAALLLFAGSAALLWAQIEGADRGVRPIASTGDFEVGGIEVNVTGDNAENARMKGWQEAQRKAWSKLWARSHGGQGASLPDSRLNDIVSAIVVEEEQIGPRRYVARLGVVFDRARTGQILGVGGVVTRSAPLMIVPVTINAGAPMVYEQRTDWQRAWARFRTADSRIDYIRPSGAGADSLVLNAGQIDRRNRIWWRVILDQFGAADILIPIARIERQWPGGPIVGTFTARYGPDNRYLGQFRLRVRDPDSLPAMLDQAVQRMDALFQRALSEGTLRPDKSLIVEQPVDEEEVEEIDEAPFDDSVAAALPDRPAQPDTTQPQTPAATVQVYTVQFASPDASAVNGSEISVRSIPGVQSAATTSLALGGTSAMRVQFAGDREALRSALQARGWQVTDAGSALRISRAGQ